VKKGIILFLLVFFLVCGVCLADGFEIGASGFMAMSGGTNVYGVGLNVAGSTFFNDFLGIGLYGNILYALGTPDGVIVLPIDLLIGPVFRIVNSGSFALPVALGFYAVNTFAIGGNGFARGFNIGVGGNASAEIKLGGSTHFYIRLQGAYELLNANEVVLTPSVGIGF